MSHIRHSRSLTYCFPYIYIYLEFQQRSVLLNH